MKSLIILAAASFKRRIKMLLLTGITIGLVTFLACLAILLFTSTGSPAEAMMEHALAPDLFFIDSLNIRDAEKSAGFWESKDEVSQVVQYPVHLDFKTSPRLNGKVMNNVNLLLSEAVNNNSHIDHVIPVNADGSTESTPVLPCPGENEIWIPQMLAETYNIKLHDTIELFTAKGLSALHVSGIVIDPLFNLPIMNPRRVWVSPGFLTANFPVSRIDSFGLAVTFKENTNQKVQNTLWKEYLGSSGFTGVRFSKLEMSAGYGFLTNIMAAVLSALSVAAFFGGLAIISSSITQVIQSDYKIIGIFQTIGLTPKNIAGIFLVQLLPVFLIFSALGASLAPSGFTILIKSMLKATGTENPTITILPVVIAGFTISLLTAGFTVLISAHKAGSVRTAEAIRFGEAVSNSASLPALKKLSSALPVWAALGFRQAQIGGKKAFAAGLTVFLAVFSAYLGIASLGAMNDLSRKPNFFDMNDSQVVLQRDAVRFKLDHSRLIRELEADPEVERVLCTGITFVTLPAIGQGLPKEVIATVLEGDLDAAGIETIYGVNPSGLLECAVNSKTAEEYGLQPGSKIEVLIEGINVTLDVTGIYQSMNNMGHGIRLTADTMRSLTPVYDPVTYDVYLNEGADPSLFIKNITNKYGEGVTARLTSEVVGDFVDSILSGMYTAILFAVIFFVFTCTAAMVSASFHETKIHSRSFAVLSLIGFEAKTIQRVIASNMFIISALASIAGIITGIIAAPVVLFLIIKNMGLLKMPLFFNLPAAAAILIITVTLSVFASWLTGKVTFKNTIRNLVTE